jgi:hypothetical protein
MQVRSSYFVTGMGMQAYAGTNGLFYSNTGIQFYTGSTVRDKDFPQGGTSAAQFAANGAFIAQTGIASTTTGTGAVIVTGGAGVSGNVNVGGNLVTGGGIINTNFGEFLVINDQLFVANVDYNTFVIDTTSGITISNLWVSLPDASVNGRTITFSIMSPVTALYLDTITPGGVKYLANTWATSGNAVVQLTYSTTSNKWLRTG